MNLTLKQQKFLDEYHKTRNDQRSLQAAGYILSASQARDYANQILSLPDAQEYLRMKKDDEVIEAVITVEGVIRDLEKAKDLAINAERFDKHGNRVLDLSSYIRATELEGKYLKMFTDKIEMDVDGHAELVDYIARKKKE